MCEIRLITVPAQRTVVGCPALALVSVSIYCCCQGMVWAVIWGLMLVDSLVHVNVMILGE